MKNNGNILSIPIHKQYNINVRKQHTFIHLLMNVSAESGRHVHSSKEKLAKHMSYLDIPLWTILKFMHIDSNRKEYSTDSITIPWYLPSNERNEDSYKEHACHLLK